MSMDSYIGNTPITETAGTRREWTPTNGQTTFTIQYAVGYLDVFVNGVKLGSADFTATNGSSFTLTSAVTDQDLVAAIAWAKGDMLPTEDYYDKAGVEERSNTKRRTYVHVVRTAAATGNITASTSWPILTGGDSQSDELISGSQDLIMLADHTVFGSAIRRVTANADCIIIPSFSVLATAALPAVLFTREVNGTTTGIFRHAGGSAFASLTLGPQMLSSGDTYFTGVYALATPVFGFSTGTSVAYEVIEL